VAVLAKRAGQREELQLIVGSPKWNQNNSARARPIFAWVGAGFNVGIRSGKRAKNKGQERGYCFHEVICPARGVRELTGSILSFHQSATDVVLLYLLVERRKAENLQKLFKSSFLKSSSYWSSKSLEDRQRKSCVTLGRTHGAK
jgi:hypothetical protein